MKKSTSYEIGQSETLANQLVILKPVTSHQKFEGTAPSDYTQFHLPLLYIVHRCPPSTPYPQDRAMPPTPCTLCASRTPYIARCTHRAQGHGQFFHLPPPPLFHNDSPGSIRLGIASVLDVCVYAYPCVHLPGFVFARPCTCARACAYWTCFP